MKKSLFVAVAAFVIAASAVPAHASHGGQFGLGVLHSSFPGIFLGVNDKTIVHFGLELQKPDSESGSGDPKLTFGILGALEYDMWSGDNWGFGLFPTLAFETTSFQDFGTGAGAVSLDSSTGIDLGLYLGGHFDPVSNVACYFRHGLDISMFDPGPGDSSTNIGLAGMNLGELGISFFFK